MTAKTCEACGNTLGGNRARRFCSVKCRANHPEFKAIAARNAVKAREARARNYTAAERRCVHCAQPFPCQPAASTRYCSRSCYRFAMAAIYDAHVTPDVEGISNFDEWLNRVELPCPVKGCAWVGEDLSHHALSVHGVRAAELKRVCGFNDSTGLVGTLLAKRLRERARNTTPFVTRGKGPPPGQGELRAEGLEHYEKGMALRKPKKRS